MPIIGSILKEKSSGQEFIVGYGEEHYGIQSFKKIGRMNAKFQNEDIWSAKELHDPNKYEIIEGADMFDLIHAEIKINYFKYDMMDDYRNKYKAKLR